MNWSEASSFCSAQSFIFQPGLECCACRMCITRMQAATKASTLGNTLVLAGIAFFHPGWSLKLIVIVYFVFMTNPVSSHALARAAHAIRNSMGRTHRRRCAQRRTARPGAGDVAHPSSLVVASFGLIFATVVCQLEQRAFLPPLAEGYVRLVPQELGAPNVDHRDSADIPRVRHAGRGRGSVHGRGWRWVSVARRCGTRRGAGAAWP